MNSLLEEIPSAGFAAREMCIRGKIPMITVVIMLRALRKLILDVPVNLKMFWGPVPNIFNGMYIHVGLEECLQMFEEHDGAHSWHHRNSNSL